MYSQLGLFRSFLKYLLNKKLMGFFFLFCKFFLLRAIIRSVSLSSSRTDARAPQATPGKTRELKLPQCYGNNPKIKTILATACNHRPHTHLLPLFFVPATTTCGPVKKRGRPRGRCKHLPRHNIVPGGTRNTCCLKSR